jgi:hypothetical protein
LPVAKHYNVVHYQTVGLTYWSVRSWFIIEGVMLVEVVIMIKPSLTNGQRKVLGTQGTMLEGWNLDGNWDWDRRARY